MNNDELPMSNKQVKEVEQAKLEQAMYAHKMRRTMMYSESLSAYLRHVKPRLAHKVSPKELEVCDGIWLGQSNATIAGHMGIHEKGVKFHIRNLHKKLEVSSRLEILAFMVAILVDELPS